MLIDVEDPLRNLILNSCLLGIVFMTVLALVPWSLLRARKLGQLAIWLPIPVLAVGLIYEAAMPVRYDIRMDLVLLIPAYGLVLFATLIRFISRWRFRRKLNAERSV